MINEARKFNMYQLISAIRAVGGTNAEIPGFILDLYNVWMKSQLVGFGRTLTKMPPEDIEKIYTAFKNQYMNNWKILDKMFDEFSQSEARK